MRKNWVKFSWTLDKTERKVKKLISHVDGSGPDQIEDVLYKVGQDVRDAILFQYIGTYSLNPRVVAIRTYRLEHALEYVNVTKTKMGAKLEVTSPSLWPLGRGTLKYAKVQEEGGVSNWGLQLPAREFLLAGVNAMQEHAYAAILDAYYRWVNES
jgi:hypothetical protein